MFWLILTLILWLLGSASHFLYNVFGNDIFSPNTATWIKVVLTVLWPITIASMAIVYVVMHVVYIVYIRGN